MTTEAILIHLSPLLFYGLLTGFLFLEAASDYEAIRTDGTIDHTMNWIARAIAAFVMAAPYIIYAKSFLFAFAILGSAAFWFSALFRWRLNKLRGKHPCYVSPSSWYDSLFLGLTWWPVQREDIIEDWHILIDRPRTHRAGSLAYIVEVVMFTLGAAYVFINIPTQ